MIDGGALRDLYGRIGKLEHALERRRGEVHGSPIPLLTYTAAADLFSGGAVTANTWTTVVPAQSFTVTYATSILLVVVAAGAFGISTGGEGQASLLIDGTTRYKFGGNYATNGNAIGTGMVPLTGLAAGGHSVEVQVFHNGGYTNLYCRCAGQPNIENASMYVTEYPR